MARSLLIEEVYPLLWRGEMPDWREAAASKDGDRQAGQQHDHAAAGQRSTSKRSLASVADASSVLGGRRLGEATPRRTERLERELRHRDGHLETSPRS